MDALAAFLGALGFCLMLTLCNQSEPTTEPRRRPTVDSSGQAHRRALAAEKCKGPILKRQPCLTEAYDLE